MTAKHHFAFFGLSVALAFSPALPLRAATAAAAAPASLSGRVQNVVTGQFLNNARVSVRGTDLVAFTDQSGTYLLPRVPAGKVALEVFYTGLDPQSATLEVAPGRSVTRDFDLTSVARYGDSSRVVKLDAFTVASGRETDADAIAINEQRFAPNIKNVVSADARRAGSALLPSRPALPSIAASRHSRNALRPR